MADPILRMERLNSWYGRGRARKQVLRNVTLSLAPGEVLRSEERRVGKEC